MAHLDFKESESVHQTEEGLTNLSLMYSQMFPFDWGPLLLLKTVRRFASFANKELDGKSQNKILNAFVDAGV